MKTYIRMIVVLTVISLLSGLVLGGLYAVTYEKAENNILKYKKIPAVADIYEVLAGELPPAEREAVEEGLLAEKRYVDLGANERSLFFIIRKDGEPYAVALEDYGQGFGGDLGVMVGFMLESEALVGIGVTTMAETPGVGTRVREPGFAEQFHGVPMEAEFKVKKDGGVIDAVSGATISSRAVAEAIGKARDFYIAHREQILDAVAQPVGESS
jgi:electron transport complex protein RnfG